MIRCCLFEAISFENDAYLTFILQYFNFDEKVWYEIGLDKKNILKTIRILIFWGDDKKIQGFIKFHTQHQKFLLDELRFEWKSILNSLLNASLLIPGVCRYILIRISQTLHLIGENPQKNPLMFFSFGDKQKVEVEFEKLEMSQQPN